MRAAFAQAFSAPLRSQGASISASAPGDNTPPPPQPPSLLPLTWAWPGGPAGFVLILPSNSNLRGRGGLLQLRNQEAEQRQGRGDQLPRLAQD